MLAFLCDRLTEKAILVSQAIGPSKVIMCCQRVQETIVVTYEIRVFFEGAQKEVFSSIFLKTL
jgi:hypothetical protein